MNSIDTSMSIISPPTVPLDRRQSPTALAVARGTQRLLLALGLSCVAELPLLSGRRADLVALGGDGEIWIVEIKSSVEDFRTDQKWTDYRLHCDRLFFATAEHVPLDIFPPDTGLILADCYGAELVRVPPRCAGRGFRTRRGLTAAKSDEALSATASFRGGAQRRARNP